MLNKIKTFKPTPFTWWIAVLSVFLIGGLAGGVYVLMNGLAATNLNDLVPWGLWITIDLSSIALSAGAFLFCGSLPARAEGVSADGTHGGIHRPDRIYDGNDVPAGFPASGSGPVDDRLALPGFWHALQEHRSR